MWFLTSLVPSAAAQEAAVAAAEQGHFPLDTIAIFVSVFIFSLILDLRQHHDHQDVSIANAAKWSIFWVFLSLCFAGWVTWRHGSEWGSMFLTGWVLEKVLSVDNLLVFVMVFKYFNIRSGFQHRILYYGILGAIVFRLVFVALGSSLLLALGPIVEPVFGVAVGVAAVSMGAEAGFPKILTAISNNLIKIVGGALCGCGLAATLGIHDPSALWPYAIGGVVVLFGLAWGTGALLDRLIGDDEEEEKKPAEPKEGEEEEEGEGDAEDEAPTAKQLWLVKAFNLLYPVFPKPVADRFFMGRGEAQAIAEEYPEVKEQLAKGVKRWMTTAFAALLVIEGSDVMFAFDSVPAVIAVTREPLLVYTAMIFAILGLRSLYFILAALLERLEHLEKAVILVLFFVTFKMLLGASHEALDWPHWTVTPNMSLVIVLSILLGGVVASKPWVKPEHGKE